MREFKFNLGDTVYAKAGVTDSMLAARAGGYAFPSAFVVTERHLQECPGGTQLHYTCSRDGKSLRFLEVELLARSEFDSEAFLDAFIAGSEWRLSKPKGESVG